MLKSISALPVLREPSSTELVRDEPGSESTDVVVTIVIPEISVTTSCSDQEDVT